MSSGDSVDAFRSLEIGTHPFRANAVGIFGKQHVARLLQVAAREHGAQQVSRVRGVGLALPCHDLELSGDIEVHVESSPRACVRHEGVRGMVDLADLRSGAVRLRLDLVETQSCTTIEMIRQFDDCRKRLRPFRRWPSRKEIRVWVHDPKSWHGRPLVHHSLAMNARVLSIDGSAF